MADNANVAKECENDWIKVILHNTYSIVSLYELSEMQVKDL